MSIVLFYVLFVSIVLFYALSVSIVLFYYCLCVNVYCTTATGCKPNCNIISYHITSHHITSHHITSHHITSHHIASHRIASHRIASHHITSHRIPSHRIASHRIASHHITSHRITSHHITSHHITRHSTDLIPKIFFQKSKPLHCPKELLTISRHFTFYSILFICYTDNFVQHISFLPMRVIFSSRLNLLGLVVLLDLTTGGLQIMKLSPVQFLQPALYWSKYFSQSLVLKHPHRIFLYHYDRRKFKPA